MTKPRDMPEWAKQTLANHYDVQSVMTEWDEDNPGQFSRVLQVVYPDFAMRFYAVDRLNENGWHQLEGTHWVPETAYAAAFKRAYHDQVPHRVREIVWNG